MRAPMRPVWQDRGAADQDLGEINAASIAYQANGFQDRHRLKRTTLKTSRLLDFASEKELVAQTGHRPEQWPLVIIKELVDNAIDATEEVGVAPQIEVLVDEGGITVADNGPGLPSEVICDILDFSVRVSSREAYVSPTRGAQGNALKTIIAMPYVLNGERGLIEIEARGVRHLIEMGVDRIRQEPVIRLKTEPSTRNTRQGLLVGFTMVNHGRCPRSFFTNCR